DFLDVAKDEGLAADSSGELHRRYARSPSLHQCYSVRVRRFCLALGFLVPMPAGAAGLVVSPTVGTAEIAGDEPLPSVKVKNEGGGAWECELAVRPPAQALDGAPRPGLETYPYSAHTLVTIKNAHFVLQPGETATVAWRAAPPARAGGGYAVLAVKGRPA